MKTNPLQVQVSFGCATLVRVAALRIWLLRNARRHPRWLAELAECLSWWLVKSSKPFAKMRAPAETRP